ncbi:hypothetical protein AAFF_G00393230 [Aldrovandia affinis]|uniref:Uncharacterized protein n=1 Tax=Aldrovandia affinis TaxID=143900 RepID=A0AAD7SDI5_9TELE|nr:hypothetical protein AAFF_G00393230 [Aldrovandia affinis]
MKGRGKGERCAAVDKGRERVGLRRTETEGERWTLGHAKRPLSTNATARGHQLGAVRASPPGSAQRRRSGQREHKRASAVKRLRSWASIADALSINRASPFCPAPTSALAKRTGAPATTATLISPQSMLFL